MQLHLSGPGREAWASTIGDPGGTMLCTDFDGVVSPIVDDPAAAWASEDVIAALARLSTHLGKVAIITGRPAREAVRLGRLDHRSLPLSVLGLYGLERWDSDTGTYTEPAAPPGVRAALATLPALLAAHDAASAHVEDKRLSVAVHTRQMAHATAAYHRLLGPLRALARRHDLLLEPGRFVLELRAPGTDKGDAVRRIVDEFSPRTVIYAGDDLGDVPAFEALRALRATGTVRSLLVCSGSDEQDALVDLADVVVPGPPGVARLFEALADALE